MADKIIYIDDLAGALIPVKAKDNGDGTFSLSTSSSDALSSVSVVDLWQKMSRAGQGFTSLTGFVTVSGTVETDFMLIRNPLGSGVLIRLKEFMLTTGSSATQSSIFRIYRNPTVTSTGTPLTISKVLTTAAQNPAALTYQSPTISNRGILIQLFEVDFRTFIRDQELSRYIPAGTDILITVQGSTTNLEHNVLAVWAEES